MITQATVRAVPKPPREAFPAWFLPDWPHAIEAAREVARAGLPLSMVRVSTPLETHSLLALAGRSRSGDLLARYLRLRGLGPERSLVLVGASGMERFVEGAVREAGSILRRHGGIAVGGSIGRRWVATPVPLGRTCATRSWEAGYALDTLETAADWTRLPDLAAVARPGAAPRPRRRRRARPRVQPPVAPLPGRVEHLRDLRVPAGGRPGRDARPLAAAEAARRARRSSPAAGRSATSMASGATTRRTWPPRRASSGWRSLGDVARRFDPDGIMNPGVLLEDGP